MLDDMVSDAPEQGAIKAGTTVRAHDDEIRLDIAREQLPEIVVMATVDGQMRPVQVRDRSISAEVASAEGGDVAAQPLAFPHDVHAGQYQMQCMYCHFSADRSVDAGIPPVSTCMGCHLVVAGTDERQQAEINRLREYAQNNQQIPWVRIYKVADHVHFPHMRHVNAGVTCQACHGQVQDMLPVYQQESLNMGWCVNCHVQRQVRYDCSVCHY